MILRADSGRLLVTRVFRNIMKFINYSRRFYNNVIKKPCSLKTCLVVVYCADPTRGLKCSPNQISRILRLPYIKCTLFARNESDTDHI